MFAGSDTTSLALTWTLLLLAQNPEIQVRLRQELHHVLPPASEGGPPRDFSSLSEDEISALYTIISEHQLLDNVCKESLRLIPPVHSSLRVATEDDIVPTSYPVMHKAKDGTLTPTNQKQVFVPKGTFVHVPIEAFNLDKQIWGDDAWKFK
jgi:cytochrome P450